MKQGKENKSQESFICAGGDCGFPECVRCPHYHDPEICRFSPIGNMMSEKPQTLPTKLFCGGTFCFDYRDDGYDKMAANDYRAK